MRACLGLSGRHERRADQGDLCARSARRHGWPFPIMPRTGVIA